MTNRLIYIFASCLILLSSCQSQPPENSPIDTTHETQTLPANQPNFNYYVETPKNWVIADTVMQDGMRIKLMKAPITLFLDSPFVNIIIVYMQGRNIDEFTTRNIDYLKSNMQGITILEKGDIDSTIYDGKWFTYNKEQNGMTTDMINYIIPFNGFAYMITGQTSKGKLTRYKGVFDRIAKSFKG